MLDKYIKNTYHRNILESLLKKHQHLIQGKILDIGSRNRRYDCLFKGTITAVDIFPNKRLNVIFGDIEKGLDFPNQLFDSIICIDVFEYLDNYQFAIKEVCRLLSFGGTAIISIPFMCYDHDDKIRFTEQFILSKFTNFSEVKSIRIGNGFTLIWDVLFRKIMKLKNISLRKLLLLLLFPYLGIIKIVNLEKVQDENYTGIFIVLKK